MGAKRSIAGIRYMSLSAFALQHFAVCTKTYMKRLWYIFSLKRATLGYKTSFYMLLNADYIKRHLAINYNKLTGQYRYMTYCRLMPGMTK